MQANLTCGQYRLQKFPGKGGWTYAEIPDIPMNKKAPFGWVCVKGHIDGYEVKRFRLMPMGNGKLFFPVKAAIRKKIGKAAGDWVTIELCPDDSQLQVPPELEDCLKDEPVAYRRFMELSECRQEDWIKWIYAAKNENTRVARIATAIEKLLKGQTALVPKKTADE